MLGRFEAIVARPKAGVEENGAAAAVDPFSVEVTRVEVQKGLPVEKEAAFVLKKGEENAAALENEGKQVRANGREW